VRELQRETAARCCFSIRHYYCWRYFSHSRLIPTTIRYGCQIKHIAYFETKEFTLIPMGAFE
jgi:hypothetical protein